MNGSLLLVLILFVTNSRLCQCMRYDNYAMYTSIPNNNDQLKFFQNLENQKYINMIFLKRPSKLYEVVQYVVNPNDISVLLERVRHFGVGINEIHSNIQQLFDAQTINRRYLRFKPDSYTWDQYHYLDDIHQWLADIAVENSNICELIHIGKTAQNRDIYALKIAMRKTAKDKVVVEAGMHGNEWISTEFVTYLAHQLLHVATSKDNRLKVVANKYQWYLVPIANPDGYVYSHLEDRLWRKNRNVYGEHTGVDLNRNFDHSFCQFGSSKNPADDVYCGPSPFSEPETLAFSNFVSKISKNLRFYFSIHAYGQKIIIPYGDTILHKENYDTTENYGAQALVKMYKLYGVKYDIGTSYDTLGEKISGTSASWVKRKYGVPFAYTFLLRDNGSVAHGLPPEEILPACDEALTGVLEIMTTEFKRLREDIYSDTDTGTRGGFDYRLFAIVLMLCFCE